MDDAAYVLISGENINDDVFAEIVENLATIPVVMRHIDSKPCLGVSVSETSVTKDCLFKSIERLRSHHRIEQIHVRDDMTFNLDDVIFLLDQQIEMIFVRCDLSKEDWKIIADLRKRRREEKIFWGQVFDLNDERLSP